MRLTEVRINLCAPPPAPQQAPSAQRNHGSRGGGCGGSRLRAFCSLTFDDAFVVRDVKLIDGNDGIFLAMPSRKLSDHCNACGEKNHLRARYCNGCGRRLNEDRHLQYRDGNGNGRLKLHADIAHPITPACRNEIERKVVEAYWHEVDRSHQPGYVPPSLDAEDFTLYDLRPDVPGRGAPEPALPMPAAAQHPAPLRAYS